jgi:hypothetical protein
MGLFHITADVNKRIDEGEGYSRRATNGLRSAEIYWRKMLLGVCAILGLFPQLG